MARDLGSKYVCFKCSTKFYDLKKPAPVCPKCGTDQREVPPAGKAERKRAAPAKAAEPAEEELLDETTEESEDEDEDEEDDA